MLRIMLGGQHLPKLRLWVVLIMAIGLTGCASERAYKEGLELVAQDKTEEGMAKFQQAMAADPQTLEYKQAYLRSREQTIATYITRANQLLASDEKNEAEKLFQRVLTIESNNSRAQEGLNKIKRVVYHDQLLKEAENAIHKKNFPLAKSKLAMILKENPENKQAKDLEVILLEKPEKPSIEFGLAPVYKKPISIEFKDVPLKQIFEIISRSSGLNFVFDKDVKTDQKTSIFLKKSTIESAIHFLLLTNQLDLQVLNSNSILIYPNTPAKQKDYQGKVIRAFFLTNIDAKTMENTLKTVLKVHDIVIDEKLNMVIIRDSADAVRLAEKLVSLQDIPESEVMLEVEVLEVNRTRLMQLGIQWPASASLTPLPLSGTAGTPTLRDILHQNAGTLSVGVSPTTINANAQNTYANLLANPRIRAKNHEKAKILIGERVPNITSTATSTGFVSESINYVDVGLTLNVEPTIYLDNDVGIKIAMEVSSIIDQIKTPSGTTAFEIGTRTANTVLQLKDGETQVLAGLINDQDTRSGNKVPGVGDLPILDHLFGTTTNNHQKTEIVLSITPHLIRNIRRPGIAFAEFPAGTENSFRLPPEEGDTVFAPELVTQTNNSLAAQLSGASAEATPSVPEDHSAVQLEWVGPKKVKVGESFAVHLEMKSGQPVTGLALALGFDKQLFQLTSMNEGNFLKEGGVQSSFNSRVDPNGQVIMNSMRSDKRTGATRLGRIATIHFKALAPAEATPIQVLSIAPTGIGGNTLSVQPSAPYLIDIAP